MRIVNVKHSMLAFLCFHFLAYRESDNNNKNLRVIFQSKIILFIHFLISKCISSFFIKFCLKTINPFF